MDFHKAKRVSLRNHPELTERWLHERLIEDTTLLGLGDLEVRDSERQQLRAGRLDLLLSDPETLTRYEVEIQLGPTERVGTSSARIEYWDIEKRRYPQYEHVAVIVAEDVTSRFPQRNQPLQRFDPVGGDSDPGDRGQRRLHPGGHSHHRRDHLGHGGGRRGRSHRPRLLGAEGVPRHSPTRGRVRSDDPGHRAGAPAEVQQALHRAGEPRRRSKLRLVYAAEAARHRAVQDPAVGRADRPARRVGGSRCFRTTRGGTATGCV